MATIQYTREQVKQHNDKQSSWIVIQNNIFDVTAFKNEHPGGEEVLLEQAGGDASEAFEDIGHSDEARELMTKYKIGEIVESERRQPVKKKNNWTPAPAPAPAPAEPASNQSSLNSWIIPIALGILATVIYGFYM